MRTSLGIGRLLRKCLSLFVIFTIFTSLVAPQTTYAANYASQIVSIAKREVGKSNVGEGNKYTSYVRIAPNSEASKLWCASFTAWCANQAGIPRNIIPAIGACDKMYEGVINGGGYVTSSPQAGDLVFYKNYKGKISHVGIMIDSTNSIQGNVGLRGQTNTRSVREFPATNMLASYPTMFYVHPNYGGNSSAGNTVAPVTPSNKSVGTPSKPTVSVNNNNASVTVGWNSVANATSYDVYLVQEPWGWGDIKYRGSTQGTSYTFTNVRDGKYAAFVIARPNKDTVQSEWRHDVIVKKAIQVTPGRTSQPAVSVNNNNASVAVSWNSVANATSYDVYLVQEPWGWGDIKYRGSTHGTNYTFTNVRDGKYAAFVIARPNKDSVQSEWSSFNVNAAPTSTVDFSNIKASNISETNAKLSASVSYSGKHPSEVGIYLGDSTGSMRKVSSDKINHSKNPFDMWYDLNKHGVTLSAGTQYYYKMYAIVDGKEFTSKTKNFWTSLTISVNSGSEKKNPDPVGMPAVSVDGSTVSVSWNSVANATSYDVYLVQEPWGWGDIKYRGSTQGTSYTFTNVRNGAYAAFVIARPNKDTVQSEWSSFNVNVASTSTADFYNINASNVSQTNAQLNASISYSGNHPSEVGVYFGNSTDSMRKVCSDAINHNKNPFDMWYSLNKYGVTLSAGTTYYYKMYAIMDGREVTSSVQSFTTPAQVNSNLVTARVSGTPGGLAINSQPNQYTKIGRMDEGVYCTIDLSRTSGNWYYVTYNGVSGYAYNRYLVIQ